MMTAGTMYYALGYETPSSLTCGNNIGNILNLISSKFKHLIPSTAQNVNF